MNAGAPQRRSHTFEFDAMGSDCALHLECEEALAAELARLAIGEAARIEARYSRYRDDSLLARINRVAAAGGTIEVDAETAALLDYAQACYRKSGGLFDPSSGVLRAAWDFASGRVPSAADIAALLPRVGFDKIAWEAPRLTFLRSGMELDLGGLCKEYAVDRLADLCIERGVRAGLVDLGGDLRVLGPHEDGQAWRIAVRHPRQENTAMASLHLSNGAVATSGDYERHIDVNGRRYGHILDPRSGWPVEGLASVSVVAERCLFAGSVATIAMLKGREGVGWLGQVGVRHLWMDAEGHQGGNL